MEARFFLPGAIAPVAPPVPVSRTGPAGRAAGPDPLHDPPLEPRDEAVFLLTAAAEVEHALMVQYLYAAYSVHVTGPNVTELGIVRDLLVQIAREEMGHLVTVQNLLHVVGGPLNLNRDRAPYASEIYPFRFTLEPVTPGSLAKYVTAESPATLPDDMSHEERDLVRQIREDAVAANGGEPVRHVGPLFERLAVLFGDGPDALTDADIRTDTAVRQASAADWGYAPLRPSDGSPLIVDSFPGADAAVLRKAARAAVQEVADQGEGFDLPPAGPATGDAESHFERFLDVYRRVVALRSAGDRVTWPVATNPNTTPEPGQAPPVDDGQAAGRITEPRARAWAQLFDLRYRMLLGRLAHFLWIDQDPYEAASGPEQGDRTARGLLLLGAFDEMRHLGKIADKLVQMPKDAGGGVHAGPPFELPYSLNLPDGEPARWRAHLDVSRAATRLVETALDPGADPFLAALVEQDTAAQQAMEALAAGSDVPRAVLPAGFAKAVHILEEAVHGFRVRARHGKFWAGTTRDEFVARVVPPVDLTPVALDRDGAVVPNPAEAQLLERLAAADALDRMPRFRPAVPDVRMAYLARWISAGAPDDDPPGRIGVRAEPDPAGEQTVPTGPLSFATDVVGLFRGADRSAMLDKFDLHRFEDVRDHSAEILDAVATGFMPCDAVWPADRVARFQKWIDDGMRP